MPSPRPLTLEDLRQIEAAAHVQPSDAERRLASRTHPQTSCHGNGRHVAGFWPKRSQSVPFRAPHGIRTPAPRESVSRDSPSDHFQAAQAEAWIWLVRDYQYLIGARHARGEKRSGWSGFDALSASALRTFIAPTAEVGHRLRLKAWEGELSAVQTRGSWHRAVTVGLYRDHPE